MKKSGVLLLSVWVVILMLTAGCGLQPSAGQAAGEDGAAAMATAVAPASSQTPAPAKSPAVWVAPGVPEKLAQQMTLPDGIRLAKTEDESTLRLAARKPGQDSEASDAVWVYALAAPFPTVTDGVTKAELMKAWQGKATGAFKNRPLLLSASTLEAFTSVWGSPAKGAVETLGPEALLAAAWDDRPSWAILPFEELEPRWKVLAVDGVSPLDKTMDAETYALAVRFGLEGEDGLVEEAVKAGLALPAGNWNPEHMTTLVMTGTTALVRTTALRMEEKGIDYPARDIADWLREADLAHISNEVPFYSDCPPARPLREEARFCSDPGYIDLFKTAGVDLVELTGNHVLDWGRGAFLETLELYRQEGYRTFGGGENLEEAQKPLAVEDHGNRLVFMGCNAVGPVKALASEGSPGAAPCDFAKIKGWIEEYQSEGYIPIVTLQHFELDNFKPQSAHRIDSWSLSNAGAVIVSGSQAHHAQCAVFNGERFIHYGLGNLFFDQMMKDNRPAFIDRHVFYEGRYLSTELLTTMLEDGARPRPMTAEERAAFLGKVFEACKQDAAYVP